MCKSIIWIDKAIFLYLFVLTVGNIATIKVRESLVSVEQYLVCPIVFILFDLIFLQVILLAN